MKQDRAEAAAQVVIEAFMLSDEADEWSIPKICRILEDAGLLVEPADRDELTSFADAVAKVTPCTCSAQRRRAERAEEKVQEREAQMEQLVAEAERIADRNRAVVERAEAERDSARRARDASLDRALRAEAEVAALRATVERVRLLDTGWKSGEGNRHAYCINPESLRAALDPEGERDR